MKITKTDNIEKVLIEHPEIAEVFLDYGLHCVGCPASGMDTLEKGDMTHGLDDEKTDEMIKRINEVIEHQE